MIETGRTKDLRMALMAVGVIFIVGIYSLIIVWPSGWSWHSGQSPVQQVCSEIFKNPA